MSTDRKNYVAGIGYSNPGCVEHKAEVAVGALDTSDPEISEAITSFYAAQPSVNWLLLGYIPKTNTLRVHATGSEGLQEMMEEMDDSRVLFGLLRYELAPGQRKEIFITWAGEGAPAVVKGNLSKHTELVGKLFKGYCTQINAREENDLTDTAIKNLLSKISAHGYGPAC